MTSLTPPKTSLPPLIDSHCHLNYDYSPKSIEDILQEAEQAGVVNLITIGADYSTLADVQAVSEKHPQIYHTIGVHPHEAITIQDSDIDILEKMARHSKCRAIGEIGLDYHYNHSPPEVQIQRLRQQLELALKLKLPVVIHSREAEEELYQELSQYASKVAPGEIPGIIHCFSGTLGFGQKCLDLGFYISFSGILTFKKAEEVREAAQAFPLDRILVETDAPYLAPLPHRGKKCEPAMVKLTAEKLAEVKGLSYEAICQATTANARRIFRIGPPA